MTTFGHTTHDIKQAIELMDRATQYLPYDDIIVDGKEYQLRRNLLDCLDSACGYLDILEKEEEEDRKADIKESAFTVGE